MANKLLSLQGWQVREEIKRVVEIYNSQNIELVLMHATSEYPAALQNSNLAKFKMLKELSKLVSKKELEASIFRLIFLKPKTKSPSKTTRQSLTSGLNLKIRRLRSSTTLIARI